MLLPFKKEYEAALKKHFGLPTILHNLFYTVFMLVLGYVALWTRVVMNVSEINSAYRIATIAITVLFCLNMNGPISYNYYMFLNAGWGIFPKIPNSLVDTYAYELKNILLDTADMEESEENRPQSGNTEGLTKVDRLEALQQNFASLHRMHHENKSIFLTIMQLCMVGGGVLSIVCIFWSTADETQESKFARIILGILISVLNWVYALAGFYGDVAGSVRWEQVIRDHLSGPAVAEKALTLGCFRNMVDFDFWLREKHDVRGNLMFGVRVDHHRLSQMASLLASAVVVSIGYGLRRLVE